MAELELTGPEFIGKVALIIAKDADTELALPRSLAEKGADIAVIFPSPTPQAARLQQSIESQGKRCLLLYGDAYNPAFAQQAREEVSKQLGRLDILVSENGHIYAIS
jgi:NAD(P)-dependent dehydrogenase (short-subunit alcohol dehydrogenase family)